MIQKDKSIKDSKRQFVLLKSEKLSAALHLVTGFLNDKEPLKWELRERSLALMAEVKESNWDKAQASIGHILSLLEVVLVNQYVSEMNFSVLKKEYQSLQDFLEQNLLTRLSASDWLKVKSEKALSPFPAVAPPLSAGAAAPAPAAPASNFNAARQKKIIDFIKQQGRQTSIGELSAAVPGVSSKTIQRELLDLVRQGVLTKVGERRWSRYALKS
jgi:hypothetical protein